MKIFVDNYKPIQLLNILNYLEKYFYSKEIRVEIYSEFGTYYINNNSFKELLVHDVATSNVKLLNFNLILDKSKIFLQDTNHLPVNHISNHVTCIKYFIKESSCKLFLNIEGITSNKKELLENNYEHFIPNNFYFEVDEEKFSMDDYKNDLIVFLSLLK
jgi:hypothetical protein